MTVTVVVAVGSNQVIGNDGQMPWPPTGDMRQFKDLTWGHPIVMGRKTFDSIGRPLPGRTSIVLTRNGDWDPGHPDVIVAPDLVTALARAAELDEDTFLIGGAQVYAEALAVGRVDRMVVTRVPLAPEGDAHLEPIDHDVWHEVAREQHEGTPDYEIVTYERR